MKLGDFKFFSLLNMHIKSTWAQELETFSKCCKLWKMRRKQGRGLESPDEFP